MDIISIILVGFVVFLTGISKSAFAGSLGVFAVPLLMLKLPPQQAIALMLPILIIADILTIKSYWKKWNTNLLYSLLPGALLGIIFAHWMINIISVEYLKKTIALICILFALRSLLIKTSSIPIFKNKLSAWFLSSLSGFSSTLIHAGGPPLIIYLSSIGLSTKQFIATASIFFAAMNIVKLIGFLSLNILGKNEIFIAFAFIPMAFIGNFIGVKIQKFLDINSLLSILNILLLVLGLWLFLK